MHKRDVSSITSSTVAVSVDKSECLMDEDTNVKVTGLSPKDKVTVIATTEQQGYTFWSHGLFSADEDGAIDLSRDKPITGSYDGVDSCGLLWSMTSAPWQPKHLRLLEMRAVKPKEYTFSVFPQSQDPSKFLKDRTEILASVNHKRWYKGPNIRRIPVNHPIIQGTLFIPDGAGPFPGVIDMYGGLVAIVEGRAALLASKGFATLALSYIHAEGLPETMTEIKFSYFEEVACWFAAQPEVRTDGLGVLALCLGGSMGLWMAQNIPNIKAVVNINGMPLPFFFWEASWMKAGVDPTKLKVTDEGMIIKHVFVANDSYFKPWNHGAHLLTVLSEDDQMTDLNHNLRLYEDIMPPDYRREKAELVLYPGAGHLIDPPNCPLCRVVGGAEHFQNWFGHWSEEPELPTEDIPSSFIMSGGSPKEHAEAQKDAWRRVIHFLKTHLM